MKPPSPSGIELPFQKLVIDALLGSVHSLQSTRLTGTVVRAYGLRFDLTINETGDKLKINLIVITKIEIRLIQLMPYALTSLIYKLHLILLCYFL